MFFYIYGMFAHKFFSSSLDLVLTCPVCYFTPLRHTCLCGLCHTCLSGLLRHTCPVCYVTQWEVFERRSRRQQQEATDDMRAESGFLLCAWSSEVAWEVSQTARGEGGGVSKPPSQIKNLPLMTYPFQINHPPKSFGFGDQTKRPLS